MSGNIACGKTIKIALEEEASKPKVQKPKVEKLPKNKIESTLSYKYTNSVMSCNIYTSGFVTYTFTLVKRDKSLTA